MIFLGGIHGVGKSTILSKILQYSKIPVFSASKLISQLKDNEYINNKNRINISSDQDILLQAIKKYIKTDNYILDGHFCLLNNLGQVERIPQKIFLNLPMKAVFVLIASPEVIIERLEKRDKKIYDIKIIEGFQNLEIKYSEEIADRMKIRFEIITNELKLIDYIKQNT